MEDEGRWGLTPDSGESRFRVEGNKVVASGELQVGESEAFAVAVQEAVNAGHEEVVVDLLNVTLISSSCVGPLAQMMTQAKKRGAHVTVLARPGIAFLLDVAGLATLGEIRTVQG